MIYSVTHKRSGETHLCEGYDGIPKAFPILQKKIRTIKDRFCNLKKQDKKKSFDEWGFKFRVTNKLK